MKINYAAMPALALALSAGTVFLAGPAAAQTPWETARATAFDPAYSVPPPRHAGAPETAPAITSSIGDMALAPQIEPALSAQCNVITAGDRSKDPAVTQYCASVPPADERPDTADIPGSTTFQ